MRVWLRFNGLQNLLPNLPREGRLTRSLFITGLTKFYLYGLA
jgi:hypothetical protein